MGDVQGWTFVVEVKLGSKVAAFIASSATCDIEALSQAGFEKALPGASFAEPEVFFNVSLMSTVIVR